MRVLEMYYKVGDLAALLRFSVQWVRDKIKAGEFGDQVHLVDGEFLVPASAVNTFLERHRYQYSDGIKARNRAELMRKFRGAEPAAVQTSGQ